MVRRNYAHEATPQEAHHPRIARVPRRYTILGRCIPAPSNEEEKKKEATVKSISRLARTALLAATIISASLLAPSARAQVTMRMGGPGGGFGGGGGGVSRASLDRYAKLLDLTPTQKETVNALHEAYMQDSAAASREMRDQMQSLQDSIKDGDMSVIHDKMPAIMKAQGEKSAALKKGFLADLKSVLTPAQQSAWPSLERLRRREQWLRFGMVSGSSVDLTTLVDGLDIVEADRAKLAPALEEYQTDMDRLLQERERQAQEDQAKAAPAGERMFDMESIQAAMKRDREQAMKVRELNQRFARVLAALLPDDKRAALEEQFKARSFRQVYGDSSAARRLTAADKLDDLTSDQRDRLARIRDSYKQSSRPLNDRWAAAQEKAENEGKAGGFPFMMFGGEGGQDDELGAARSARRDLDKKTADQINEVLTPDQQARLPKQQGRGQFGRFADFGGGDGDMVATFVSEEDSGDGSAVQVHSIVISGDEPAGGESRARVRQTAPPPPPKP